MDFNQIRIQAQAIICRIGAELISERRSVQSTAVEVKGLNDFVTAYDKRTEQLLVAELGKLLPESGFIAEEKTSNKVSDELNWIIDPIDGTTNFIHGLPIFAISVALQYRDQLVVGVVYELGADECFSASLGGGAFLNDSPIRVSATPTVSGSLIATGFPYNNYMRMEAYMKSLDYLMRHSHGLRRLGSAATDLAYVACGRFEAFYEYDLKPWDVAAGALIVKEAGGMVTDFSGGDNFLFGGELVATNNAICNEFLGLVSSYMVNN